MNQYEIKGVFPCPLYTTQRDSNIDVSELEDIKNIIEEGMYDNKHNSTSNNSYIFDTKLKNIKEFCEQHIKIYVEKVINPKEDTDFYITQSWLNITKPNGSHHDHSHQNSIISGVFYISTEEEDSITVGDPNFKVKEFIKFASKENNIWNSISWTFPVNTNELILFPSWLSHVVKPNNKATTDRISLSFNVFARGIFGEKKGLTKLHLQ